MTHFPANETVDPRPRVAQDQDAATGDTLEMLGTLAPDPPAPGLGAPDIRGLTQAYLSAIDRVVAAEVNLTARLLTRVAPEHRRRWADRWIRDLTCATTASLHALHAARLAPRITRLVDLPNDPNAGPRSVAFVDLRGSTAYMADHDTPAIRALIDGMFAAAQRITRDHDVAVAKHLGDGVMLVGLDPAEMLAAGRAAAREMARTTPLTAGVGIDFGALTTRAGDYFGTPVNRAARLAELAQPDEVVLSETAVPEPAPAGTWRDVAIRGLPRPVRALTVRA